MFKRLIRAIQRLNPFIKYIKVVHNGSSFERHGNCIDIKLPNDFNINVSKPTVIYVPLGFRTRLPKYYRGVLFLRSSSPLKYNIDMPGGHGEIEWNYSDEWKGIIKAYSNSEPILKKGNRVFQFYIEPIWDAPWYVKLSHIFATYKIRHVSYLSILRSGLGHTGN